MDPDLRNQLLDAVHRRATQLVRLTEPGGAGRGVDTVLVMVAGNLMRTLVALFGVGALQEWLGWLFAALVESHGVCRFCSQNPLVQDAGMCQSCWDQSMREDREVEEYVQMHERPPQGGVS